MSYVIEAVVLTLVFALTLLWVVQRLLDSHQAAEAVWGIERRELLSRIQRPDYVPLPAPDTFAMPEPEPDELGLINTIADPPSVSEDSTP